LNRETVEELIYKAKNLRDRLFVDLQARCGLRIGELLKVKMADELCIDRLNLMPIVETSLKNYYDFIHFTPSGAGVVAEAVAGSLIRNKKKGPGRLQADT
jgi:hypothetical protein